MIQYFVRLADLNRHHFEIECRVENPDAEQRFTLPSWIPGSYLLREFARHVVSIRAECDGREVAAEKISKSSWCCRSEGSVLTVTIRVYALDQSVRGAYLDGRRGFFNGTCVFLSPEGRGAEPVRMTLDVPTDSRCEAWRVATSMSVESIDERGFGTYTAADYDELIDHPFEISDFNSVHFEAGGVGHRLVIAGRHRTDLDRVATDLSQLCQTQIEFFGTPVPFESYSFFGLAVGDGYGGLEHRASSSLIFSRDDLPVIGEPGVPKNYQRFLSLCSHEYFHTWNVKRIKPKAFVPYRLDRRNHTRLMWVFEGITSYYQDLMLVRSDLIGEDAYLARLAPLLTRVYRVPGRHVQSASDSSFEAWDKLYKPEANSANATVSYYSKGALIALALDLTLRGEERVTLDRIMQELWSRYQAGSGVEEDEFEALAQELSGMDLSGFFDKAVRGTDDLPLSELLSEFGVTFELSQASGPNDPAGSPRAATDPALDLGIRFKGQPGGLRVTAVLDGGPAEAAGLNPGDVLIALDGLSVSAGNLAQRLHRHEGGDAIPVTFFRGDELLQYTVILSEAAADTCQLKADPEASEAMVARRNAWIGGGDL